MRLTRKNQKGMTLIELLVVVGIIGVLSAVALVNYLIALDKSKQKKTMADIQAIAVAWESRASDRGAYNAAGATADVFDWPTVSISQAQLEAMLSPTYIRPMARTDGWGHQFDYALDVASGSGEAAAVYAIRSPGKDGNFDSAYPDNLTKNFDCDIVYANGNFLVYPAIK
jgi:prepilin-type N-terminal cleavage/methylation domain-containing protein